MIFQGPEGLSGVLCKSGSILHPSQELQPNGVCSYIRVCVCVCVCERERKRDRERKRERERVRAREGLTVKEVYLYVYWGNRDQLCIL